MPMDVRATEIPLRFQTISSSILWMNSVSKDAGIDGTLARIPPPSCGKLTQRCIAPITVLLAIVTRVYRRVSDRCGGLVARSSEGFSLGTAAAVRARDGRGGDLASDRPS